MTRDEAEAYILAHPAQFAGWPVNTVLGRVRSFNDPDFYDPTLFVAPEEAKTPTPNPVRRAVASASSSVQRAMAPAPSASAPSAAWLGVPKSVWFFGAAVGSVIFFARKR